MNPISAERAGQILRGAASKSIAVLGDFMLDRHLKGTVNRISPEAPVPVVEIVSESTGLGGAGNVIQNLAALGIRPFALGVVGDDAAGEVLVGHLNANSADTQGILLVKERKTTEKVRIIARDQHVVRVDRETGTEIDESLELLLLKKLQSVLPGLKGLILQDYNKGVLTKRVIETAIELAIQHGVAVAVDPKFDNFFLYRRSHLFKPNVRELERALGTRVQTDDELISAGRLLYDRIMPEILLVTRGEMGMTLFLNRDRTEHIPTHAMKVHDVSGAGDTVIATFLAAESGGASPNEAAILANVAAGIVCGEVGVVPINRQRLLEVIAE